MTRMLLEWSIRAVLMAAGAGLAVAVLRVRAAAALYRVWMAAAIGMLLLPAWVAWGPAFTAPAPVRALDAVWVAPEASATGDVRTITPRAVSEAAASSITQHPQLQPPQPQPLRDWTQTFLVLYLAGVALMLARLLAGTIRVWRIARRARREGGIAVNSHCAAPVTLGWLHPAIVLPPEWPEWPAAKLEAVLAHEREHVRRRDPLTRWLALWNRAVFWFHPLAWWLERKLATLAEQACDEAVLRGGHDPHAYAGYLIELARSVQERGGGFHAAGAAAFSDGQLRTRIRGILGPAQPVTPRAKSWSAAAICGAAVAACLACKVSNPPRAQDDPALNAKQGKQPQEMREHRQISDAAALAAAKQLTTEGAKQLDAYVRANAYDGDKTLELVRYYEGQSNWKALSDLAAFFIEQHPEIRAEWEIRPAWDHAWSPEGYVRAKSLWTARLRQPISNSFVYMNAAEFLAESDKDQAEQILLEGQRKFPLSALHWEVFRARLYAWTLGGLAGPLPDGSIIGALRQTEARTSQSAFAQKVRAELLASSDVELLTRTVEQLQGSAPNVEFTQSLVQRVLATDPRNRWAHLERYDLRVFAAQQRLKADPAHVTGPDRMAAIEGALRFPHPDMDAEEMKKKARELVALVKANGQDPDAGAAFFTAQMAMARVSMHQGNVKLAASQLVTATAASHSDYLKYAAIDMYVPQWLLDAGERDAVTKFLDQCATFNESRQLRAWAEEIREGKDPGLRPITRVRNTPNG